MAMSEISDYRLWTMCLIQTATKIYIYICGLTHGTRNGDETPSPPLSPPKTPLISQLTLTAS